MNNIIPLSVFKGNGGAKHIICDASDLKGIAQPNIEGELRIKSITGVELTFIFYRTMYDETSHYEKEIIGTIYVPTDRRAALKGIQLHILND